MGSEIKKLFLSLIISYWNKAVTNIKFSLILTMELFNFSPRFSSPLSVKEGKNLSRPQERGITLPPLYTIDDIVVSTFKQAHP